MASRTRTRFRCTACEQTSPVWNGRCAGCGAWNTLTTDTVAPARSPAAASGGTAPTPLADLHAIGARPVPVGVAELDRVLAGGLVPGSATLLAGPPGVGKSTLALQLALGLAAIEPSAPVVYLAAEETVAQIRLRADRLGLPVPAGLLVGDDPCAVTLAATITDQRPAAVIVDSIQAMDDEDATGNPGSVAQVRAGAARLAGAARAAGTSLVLIGHVTKDGSIAGPRTLEHLVDTVVSFDADLDHGLRLLRAVKHRFGPVGELGVFRMERDGLHGVGEVAGMFLQDRRLGRPGSVVTPALDGRRTLLVEIQALVAPDGPAGLRLCQGLERGRVELIRLVLERARGAIGEVSCSVAGGFTVREAAVDLAAALAVASAAVGRPVAADTVVTGELGLVGEVRRVGDADRRLREAARLGFRRAIVPAGTPASADALGLDLSRVGDLDEALRAVGIDVPRSPRRGRPDAAALQPVPG